MATATAVAVRPPLLGPGWPLAALFVAFPLWWVLGLGAFVWPLVGVFIAAGLLMRSRVRVPRGFGVWILFLGWMMVSTVQVDEPQRWVAFLYRAAIYLSATLLFVHLFNTGEDRLPWRRVTTVMTWFWGVAVVAGFLALLLGERSFTSPVEALLPASLTGNDFVRELVRPGLAQVQDFLGYPVARPKAPFVYTNEWGANIALLTPFAVTSFLTARTAARKAAVGAILVASVVPIVVSLNRGLWLSLGVAVVYATARLALRGRLRPLVALSVFGLFAAALVVATPLGTLVADRIATPHSNESRAALYSEATEGVLESPLLGYGSPRPSERDPNLPSVGTHGQLWLVMFSHGIPGAVLFVSWFAYAFWRSRRAPSDVGFWMHVVLFIALVQMPYYGMLPVPIHVVMVAAALAWRPQPTRPSTEEAAVIAAGVDR